MHAEAAEGLEEVLRASSTRRRPKTSCRCWVAQYATVRDSAMIEDARLSFGSVENGAAAMAAQPFSRKRALTDTNRAADSCLTQSSKNCYHSSTRRKSHARTR